MEKIPIVHLYAQYQWHDDAHILANREGLLALQRAIAEALENGRSTAEAFVCDGEGFDIRVVMKNNDLSEWREVAVPYISDIASEKNAKAQWPWDLWRK